MTTCSCPVCGKLYEGEPTQSAPLEKGVYLFPCSGHSLAEVWQAWQTWASNRRRSQPREAGK